MSKDLLILAAGLGQRFGGLKQLVPVGRHGEAIMDYTAYDAREAGFDRVVLVIRRAIESAVRAHVESGFGRHIEVEYVFQDLPPARATTELRCKPWGTAQAVLAGRAELSDHFAVANADDFYGRQALITVGRFLDHQQTTSAPTWGLVGFRADATLPPSGAVSRGVLRSSAGALRSISEISAMSRHPEGVCWQDGGALVTVSGSTLVSMNLWAFSPPILAELEERFTRFLAKNPGPDEEFLLPVVVGELLDRHRVQVLETTSEWCGVTTAADLAWVQGKIVERLTANAYPSPLWE